MTLSRHLSYSSVILFLFAFASNVAAQAKEPHVRKFYPEWVDYQSVFDAAKYRAFEEPLLELRDDILDQIGEYGIPFDQCNVGLQSSRKGLDQTAEEVTGLIIGLFCLVTPEFASKGLAIDWVAQVVRGGGLGISFVTGKELTDPSLSDEVEVREKITTFHRNRTIRSRWNSRSA